MKTITYDETKWKLVPIEPTDAMKYAPDVKVGGCYSCSGELVSGRDCAEIYRAMIDATPQAPDAGKDGQFKDILQRYENLRIAEAFMADAMAELERLKSTQPAGAQSFIDWFSSCNLALHSTTVDFMKMAWDAAIATKSENTDAQSVRNAALEEVVKAAESEKFVQQESYMPLSNDQQNFNLGIAFAVSIARALKTNAAMKEKP